MQSALVTVIIPTIGRDSLSRAAGSVINQTCPTFLIVSKDPARSGCGPTLNNALPDVSTEWVATMGDDDELHPQYTETFESQKLDQLDMVILAMRYGDGSVLPKKQDPDKLMRGDVGATYIVRTDMVRRLGGWMKSPGEEDWDMILRCRAAGARIKIVTTVRYYVHGIPEAGA